MYTFRLAFSGDFLNEAGHDACGELPLSRLDACPYIKHSFVKSQAPTPGDSNYYRRFYSLVTTPAELQGQNGYVTIRPAVRRDVLASAAETLTAIGRSGAGYDKVDVASCSEFGVVLFNVPQALDHSTASTALLFLLALAKRLKSQERITREGRWDRQAAEIGQEIRGRTLGIIGFGHSGRELARLVAPFGMRLLSYSPHADPTQAAALGADLVSLDQLLRESDFVSIHARPRPENRHLLSAPQLALMKPTAFVVNIARGELIDQLALVEALRTGKIAGAGLDVFEVEPLPLNDPLLQLDNVIVTPHWNASTRDVWRTTGNAMVDGMLRIARGELPENIVNREVLENPRFQEKLRQFEVNRS